MPPHGVFLSIVYRKEQETPLSVQRATPGGACNTSLVGEEDTSTSGTKPGFR